jgi:hypothetical protein
MSTGHIGLLSFHQVLKELGASCDLFIEIPAKARAYSILLGHACLGSSNQLLKQGLRPSGIFRGRSIMYTTTLKGRLPLSFCRRSVALLYAKDSVLATPELARFRIPALQAIHVSSRLQTTNHLIQEIVICQ